MMINTKGEKGMNKWGVRLISVYFFAWAISKAVGIDNSKGSSYSIKLPFYNHSGQIDLMGWIGVCVLLYVSYNLLRFNAASRTIALISLWPSVIGIGFFLALITYYAINALVSGTYATADSSMTFYFFHTKWPGEVTNPALIFLIIAGKFMLALAPLYILMRKDLKRLFDKPVVADESTAIPTGESS
jgi:hypothetical protein